jgi:hypothetical protein
VIITSTPGPANIFGKEHLVKNLLISTIDKVIYYKGTFFSGAYKTSLPFTK